MPRTIQALQLDEAERAACAEAARAAGIDDAVKAIRALLKAATVPVAELARAEFAEPAQLLHAHRGLEVFSRLLAEIPQEAAGPVGAAVARARAVVEQGLALGQAGAAPGGEQAAAPAPATYAA